MDGLTSGLHDGLSLHDLQPPSLTHDTAHTPTHGHDHTHDPTHALAHRHTPAHDALHHLEVTHAHDAVHGLSHAHASTHGTPASHAGLGTHQTGVSSALRGPPPLHPLTPTPSTVLPPTPTDKKPPIVGESRAAFSILFSMLLILQIYIFSVFFNVSEMLFGSRCVASIAFSDCVMLGVVMLGVVFIFVVVMIFFVCVYACVFSVLWLCVPRRWW